MQYDLIKGFFETLGFPTWLVYPLAIAKILGVIAILTTAVLLPVSSFAQSLGEALSQVKASLDLRFRYEFVDQDAYKSQGFQRYLQDKFKQLLAMANGVHLTSMLLHLMGAAVGIPLGIYLLKKGYVDCEGWDWFSMRGRAV